MFNNSPPQENKTLDIKRKEAHIGEDSTYELAKFLLSVWKKKKAKALQSNPQ